MCYTKRPAVLLAISYFGALGVSYLLSEFGLSLWLLAVYAAVFLFIYTVLFDGKRHLFLSVAVIAAVLFAGLQFRAEIKTRTMWEELRGETVSVRGVVEEVAYTSDSVSYMTAKITEVNGERTSVGLSLSMTGGIHLSEFESFSGEIKVLSEEESGGYIEKNSSYYRSKGIVCEAELQSDGLVRQGTPFSLRGSFETLRTKLCAPLSRYIAYDELSFLSGMVFGDRDAISQTVARDFRRTGTSHMLAVSGTHLSIMIAGLYYLCKKLRIGHAPTVVMLLISAFLIVCITGFSLSVLRAALMWGIGALAYVFGGKRDGYSALALAVMIICACDVCAMYDVGLQMSVLSTLGILMLGIPTDKWLAKRLPQSRAFQYLRKYGIMPVVLTVSSTIFTLPTAIVSYGELSLIAPLANLLLALPTAFLLITTPILLLLICLPIQIPAYVLAFFVSGVTKLTLGITNALSELPDLLLGIKYPFTPIVIIISCIFALLLYHRKKSALVIYAAFFAGCLMFVSCYGVYYGIYRDRVTVIYQMKGKNESVGIMQGRAAVLIDISNGASGANYDAWRALSDRQATELDALILTHYDRKHDAMLADIFEHTVVRSLYLPKPVTATDMEVYTAICSADYARDIACYEYDALTQELHFEDVRITPSESVYLSRSDAPVTVLSIDVGTQRLAYVSSAAWETEEENDRAYLEEILSDAEYLICGNHGPKIKTAYGMRQNMVPYRFVCIPMRESAALFSHTAEMCAVAEETEYIELHLSANGR